jgi:hypothetical protein
LAHLIPSAHRPQIFAGHAFWRECVKWEESGENRVVLKSPNQIWNRFSTVVLKQSGFQAKGKNENTKQ